MRRSSDCVVVLIHARSRCFASAALVVSALLAVLMRIGIPTVTTSCVSTDHQTRYNDKAAHCVLDVWGREG